MIMFAVATQSASSFAGSGDDRRGALRELTVLRSRLIGCVRKGMVRGVLANSIEPDGRTQAMLYFLFAS